jgi:drug/metabolite transporter (DMT)-like permease
MQFFALMAWSRLPLPRGRALAGALLYGALAIASGFALVYWGLVDVKAGHGQAILSLAPLMTLLLAAVHGLERFEWRALAGAAVASAGVAVVFADQVSANVPVLSMLAIVLAAACAAEGGIVMKLFPPASLVSTNAVAMSVGAVSLLFISFVSGEPHAIPQKTSTWLAFGYLATAGTVGTFLLVLYVLRHWTASQASYQFVLAPAVAVALAALLLDEGVSVGFFAGAGLVLAGVYIGVLSRPQPPPLAGEGAPP